MYWRIRKLTEDFLTLDAMLVQCHSVVFFKCSDSVTQTPSLVHQIVGFQLLLSEYAHHK